MHTYIEFLLSALPILATVIIASTNWRYSKGVRAGFYGLVIHSSSSTYDSMDITCVWNEGKAFYMKEQNVWSYFTTITLGMWSYWLWFDSKWCYRCRGQRSDPCDRGGTNRSSRCCVIYTHFGHKWRRCYSDRTFTEFSSRIDQGLNYRQNRGTRNWVRIGLALHNFTLNFT